MPPVSSGPVGPAIRCPQRLGHVRIAVLLGQAHEQGAIDFARIHVRAPWDCAAPSARTGRRRAGRPSPHPPSRNANLELGKRRVTPPRKMALRPRGRRPRNGRCGCRRSSSASCAGPGCCRRYGRSARCRAPALGPDRVVVVVAVEREHVIPDARRFESWSVPLVEATRRDMPLPNMPTFDRARRDELELLDRLFGVCIGMIAAGVIRSLRLRK